MDVVHEKMSQSRALACLAVESVSGEIIKLSLNSPVSLRYRVQMFAPIALQCENTNFRNYILSFLVEYCQIVIDPSHLSVYYQGFSPVNLISTAISYIFLEPKTIKKESNKIFTEFCKMLITSELYKLLGRLISPSENEEKMSVLLRFMVRFDIRGSLANYILIPVLKLRPAETFVRCFRILCRYLKKIEFKWGGNNKWLQKNLREVYNEIVANLDTENDAIKEILVEFRKLI